MLKRELERDGALHVRATVVDRPGDRHQPLEDGARGRVILRLAGGDEVEQRLGRHVAVADQQAVHVEHRRQQPLVMARRHLQLGVGRFQRRDLDIPALHVAHAVLGGNHAVLPGNLELGVEVVAGLGHVGILEQDLLEPGVLPDRPVAFLRRAFLVAEPDPAVVRVDERAGGTGFARTFGLLGRGHGAFLGDARNDRDLAVHRLDIGLDQPKLFFRGEIGALAGVAEDDEALHPVHGRQPFGDARVGGVVYFAIGRKSGDGAGFRPRRSMTDMCSSPGSLTQSFPHPGAVFP